MTLLSYSGTMREKAMNGYSEKVAGISDVLFQYMYLHCRKTGPMWCIQFQKSPVWLPILVAKGPYCIKMWVLTSLRFGSQFPSSQVPNSFPHSAFDPAVLTDFRRGRCRIETDVSNNKPTTFEEQEKAGARTVHPQLRPDSDNALSLWGFLETFLQSACFLAPGCHEGGWCL